MDQYATADFRQTGGMTSPEYGRYRGLPQEDGNGSYLNEGYAGENYTEGSYDGESHAVGNNAESGKGGIYDGESREISGGLLPDGFTECGWMERSPFEEETRREGCRVEYSAVPVYGGTGTGKYFQEVPVQDPGWNQGTGSSMSYTEPGWPAQAGASTKLPYAGGMVREIMKTAAVPGHTNAMPQAGEIAEAWDMEEQVPEETRSDKYAAGDYGLGDDVFDESEPEGAEADNAESESAESDSTEPDSSEGSGKGQPEDIPAEADFSEERKRAEHEAAEEKRKAEWEAERQARKDAEAEQLARLSAMGDEEVAAEAMKRVGADTEKLTRRNMKDCVSEYVQTLCLEDPDFARLAMHPRKTMIRCFRYINRKAREFIEQEMKDNDIKPENGIYGSDVPDGLCYQWAEDYFRSQDAEEDREKEEKFVPKPYTGAGGSKASSRNSAGKKSSSKKEGGRKPGTGGRDEKSGSAGKSAGNGGRADRNAGDGKGTGVEGCGRDGKAASGKTGGKKTGGTADDGQLSFMDQLTLEGCFAQEVKAG